LIFILTASLPEFLCRSVVALLHLAYEALLGFHASAHGLGRLGVLAEEIVDLLHTGAEAEGDALAAAAVLGLLVGAGVDDGLDAGALGLVYVFRGLSCVAELQTKQEQRQKQTQIPFGNDNQRSEGQGPGQATTRTNTGVLRYAQDDENRWRRGGAARDKRRR
jgi:hypothetical protein